MEAVPAKRNALAGKRILVTAFDLEQREHRGIAMYSKKLIRALAECDAEVWLLTEKSSPLTSKSAKFAGSNAARSIAAAHILEQLAYGRTPSQPGSLLALAADYIPGIRWLQGQKETLKKAAIAIAPKQQYRHRDLTVISLNHLTDNPYLREERMGYLFHVTGIISAPGIYTNSMSLALRLPRQEVKIDLRDFDVFITTCPLNILPTGCGEFIQTIHDIIPIEYVSHNEDQIVFTNRLKACQPSKRLFVSNSTCHKYHGLMGSSPAKQPVDTIVVQPSTLEFDESIYQRIESAAALRPNPKVKGDKGELKPLRYFLFNSSIEKRKNLLLAVKAFSRSNLANKGIKLCITGALKPDSYSEQVRSWTQNNPMILLTDYVDDYTKSELFLNALGLLSTSLVEGFGIPVLDAACLGLTTIASDSASHAEIAQQRDFQEHILICSTHETSAWSEAMQLVSRKMDITLNRDGQERAISEVIKKRIHRFNKISLQIEHEFGLQILQSLGAGDVPQVPNPNSQMPLATNTTRMPKQEKADFSSLS